MLSESPYSIDLRVRQEAQTLVRNGYRVSVIAQFITEKDREGALKIFGKAILGKQQNAGVTVYRVPILDLFRKSEGGGILHTLKSLTGFAIEYTYFTAVCALLSLNILVREGLDVIHLHNPPNTLFVVGLFYRMLGKRFVFDHHDLAPELYLARTGKQGGLIHDYLLVEEKLCLRSADIVLATNHSYREIDIERGGKRPESVYVVRNGPDLESDYFQESEPFPWLMEMGKTILLYLGFMGPQDGVDHLVRALGHLKEQRQDWYCLFVGPGDEVEKLKRLAESLRLSEQVRFTGFVSREDFNRYLASAHICLDPNPSNPLNDHSTWLKVLEYMAAGKPLISFDLKETRFTAQEAALYVEPNDERKYADAISALMDSPVRRREMGEYGRTRMEAELCWEHVSKELLRAYRELPE